MMRFTIGEQAFTPVPTVFIKEYMCDAQDSHVKVYLYALYLAGSGGEIGEAELEEKLNMSSLLIKKALQYWIEQGLIRVDYEGKFEFLPTPGKQEKQPKKQSALYGNRDFNLSVGALLHRSLLPAELEKIYDFTDIFGLPQDVVILMVKHCVDMKGKNVSIAYLDKVAQTWAQQGINTVDKAHGKVDTYSLSASGTRAVLKTMGIHARTPGPTEMEYYRKWTQDWGFTQDAILLAMQGVEFATISQPFKYLDAVLRKLYEQGKTSARTVSESRAAQDERMVHIKEMLAALEARSAPQPRHEKIYEGWSGNGFSHDLILLACRDAAESGSHRLDAVDTRLQEWQRLGLTDALLVKKHLREQAKLDEKIKQVFAGAGINKEPGEAERKFYTKYTDECGMKHDVLMYAADISSVAERPYPFLRKVLAEWAEKGVKGLREAKAQNINRFTREIKNGKDFAQHDYTKDEMEQRKLDAVNMMENLDD